MKIVNVMISEERYCECPYCGSTQSDRDNQDQGFELMEAITCADCGKKFKAGKIWN